TCAPPRPKALIPPAAACEIAFGRRRGRRLLLDLAARVSQEIQTSLKWPHAFGSNRLYSAVGMARRSAHTRAPGQRMGDRPLKRVDRTAALRSCEARPNASAPPTF